MKAQGIIRCILDFFLFLELSPVLLIGGYVFYDAMIVCNSAEIAKEYVEMANSDDGSVFERISAESSAVVGWLTIDDTGINYPLVQGNNNSYYLARNYKGEYATAGSAFLDYRNASDFSDSITVIYGHRMGYGKMFSDVTKFAEKGFFSTHETGKLLVPNGKYRLEIVLFAKIRADEILVYDVAMAQDGRALEYLNNVAINSRNVDYYGKFLLLSTCDANNKQLRDVLLIQVRQDDMVQ